MALTCNAFGGFEMGDANESHGKVGITQSDFRTDITPAHGTERWVMELAETSPAKVFRTDYFTPSDKMIFGCYVRFENLTPNGPVYFMSGFTAGIDYDIRLRLNTDGTLGLVNSVGGSTSSSGSPFTANTWHRVELYWERLNSGGVAKVYVDGVLSISGSGDSLNDAGDTDVAMELSGQAGVAAASCTTWFNSFYYLTGATSETEILGDYEVIGPYVTDHDTVVADAKVGGGLPDDLDAGTWRGASDVQPQGIPYAKYDNTHQSCKRTNGWIRGGPRADGRIVNANIVAGSWVYKAYRASAVAQYGYYDVGPSTYHLAEGAAVPDSGNLSIVKDAGSGYVPSYDDYFCWGFRSNDARGSVIEDVWCNILQTITEGERTRLHVKGGAIKGATLCP